MERNKALVIATAIIGFGLFLTILFYQGSAHTKPLVLDTEDCPTIGNPSAKIHVVIIEDFRCRGCADFSQKYFPKLQSQYIKPGQVRYTVVPVAFVSGSKEIANAALEVYTQAPSQFFPFIHEVFTQFQEGILSEKNLLRIARNLDGVDINRLQTCMNSRCHYKELDENLQWAKEIMGNDFRTPTLYVNGVRVRASFQEVVKQIDLSLKENP